MDDRSPTAATRAPDPEHAAKAAQTAEHEDLRRHVRSLSRHAAQLSHRLMRVEQSAIFRFLRWLGSCLLEAPAWTQRILPFARMLTSSAPIQYAQWMKKPGSWT